MGYQVQAWARVSENPYTLLSCIACPHNFQFAKKQLPRYKPKDETSKEETPAFVPRIQIKRPLDGKYKDRAEMRRAGVDDEYKPVSERTNNGSSYRLLTFVALSRNEV